MSGAQQQPDPAPKKEGVSTPQFEAGCNALFWGESLPAIPLHPALNLQAKLDAAVAERLASEAQYRDPVVLGSRTDVLAVGSPTRIERDDKKTEVVVPYLAITGLSNPDTAPTKRWNGAPEMRLGIYYTGTVDGSPGEGGKLTLFKPIGITFMSGSTAAGFHRHDDIIAGLQWLHLIAKVGRIDSEIISQSQRTAFQSPASAGEFRKLQDQIGVNTMRECRLKPLGNIDQTLALAVARGLRYDESRLAYAARSEPPIVQPTPLVLDRIADYEDRSIPVRRLDKKFTDAESALKEWSRRGLAYRWNLHSACEKHPDVRPAMYVLLVRAENFRQARTDMPTSISQRLLNDLNELGSAMQSALAENRVLIPEGVLPTLNKARTRNAAAITHAEKLNRGYPTDIKHVRSSFLQAIADFRGLRESVEEQASAMGHLSRYIGAEEQSSVRGGELVFAWQSAAAKILSGLNRDLRLHCEGLFPVPRP